MVKLLEGPVHPFDEGVTVMVAVTGEVPLLTALKEGMFPVPDAASPIPGALFVQLKEVPLTGPLKLIAEVVSLLQSTALLRVLTDGVGFTVIVKVAGVPVQLLAEGVTLIVAVTGVDPVLPAMKEGRSPVPEAGSPMEVLSFSHKKLLPVTAPCSEVAGIVSELQTTRFEGGTTVGIGLTSTDTVTGFPVQPFAVGLIV